MAIGIRFYRDRKLKGLEDSLETEEFTLFLNNMFDVLNRKFPAEGIKKHSKDLEVIYVFLLCVYWPQIKILADGICSLYVSVFLFLTIYL